MKVNFRLVFFFHFLTRKIVNEIDVTRVVIKVIGDSSMILKKIPKRQKQNKNREKNKEIIYQNYKLWCFRPKLNLKPQFLKQSLDWFRTYSNSGTRRREVFVKNRSETFDIDRHKPIWINRGLISWPGFLNRNCSSGFHRSLITKQERNRERETIIMLIKKHRSTTLGRLFW